MPIIHKLTDNKYIDVDEWFSAACEIADHEEIVQIGKRYFQIFYGPEHDSWIEVNENGKSL